MDTPLARNVSIDSHNLYFWCSSSYVLLPLKIFQQTTDHILKLFWGAKYYNINSLFNKCVDLKNDIFHLNSWLFYQPLVVLPAILHLWTCWHCLYYNFVRINNVYLFKEGYSNCLVGHFRISISVLNPFCVLFTQGKQNKILISMRI